MTDIYSAASLGKQALNQFNIKPFMQQNPDFPFEILGYLMSAYYGGRVNAGSRKHLSNLQFYTFSACIQQ